MSYIKFVEFLASESAAIIKPYFRSGVAVDDKSDGSPVTVADRNAESKLRELIMQAYPEHGIRGEEFEDHQPEAAYQWVLDPIDGTKNFIAGTPMFGTLIALLEHGKPILGAINFPILDQLLIGTNGETRLNGEKVSVRQCAKIEDATFLVTAHWDVEKYQNFAAFEALTRRAKIYRSWGDCYGYYLLATGYADMMLDPIMNPWDLLPLIPIIEGAGGTITDWQGNDPVTGTSIVAATRNLHAEIIHALNPD